MLGLADCNNFFVSCERSVDPSLEGKAVVVLSNNDGCVVARSNESKRMGVKMGQPAFELKDQIRSGALIALSGNHLLYREISLKVHDIFRRYAPSTLDYSIDEAFLDMDTIPLSNLIEIGESMCDACLREAGVPVTIGFAPTKTLSKIVCEAGKKCGRRVSLSPTANDARPLMETLPIQELWGVGRRLTKKLYQKGIFTIADFADRDLNWVRSLMGVTGERSWMELHGHPCIELSHVDQLLQDSISETRTFPEDITDYDYVRARIAIYSADCCRKLRAMKGVCRSVTVMLRTNRFRAGAYLAPEATTLLPDFTADSSTVVAAAISLLDHIWRRDTGYKRAGVLLTDIRPASSVTPSLFNMTYEGPLPQRNKRLLDVIDGLNDITGHSKIRLASQMTAYQKGHNDGYSSSFGAPFDPKKKS